MSRLPYRPAVGAALFGPDGRVLVARRASLPADAPYAWQMPQGGIDPGERPEQAVLRELEEEIGTREAAILAEHDEWLSYELPGGSGAGWRGRYRGQRQRWFALRFTGEERAIRLDAHKPVEFDAWRWVALAEVPALVVPFKRAVYEAVARAFARFAEGG